MTNNRQRGFELVAKYKDHKELIPKPETAHAAGYDLNPPSAFPFYNL